MHEMDEEKAGEEVLPEISELVVELCDAAAAFWSEESTGEDAALEAVPGYNHGLRDVENRHVEEAGVRGGPAAAVGPGIGGSWKGSAEDLEAGAREHAPEGAGDWNLLFDGVPTSSHPIMPLMDGEIPGENAEYNTMFGAEYEFFEGLEEAEEAAKAASRAKRQQRRRSPEQGEPGAAGGAPYISPEPEEAQEVAQVTFFLHAGGLGAPGGAEAPVAGGEGGGEEEGGQGEEGAGEGAQRSGFGVKVWRDGSKYVGEVMPSPLFVFFISLEPQVE